MVREANPKLVLVTVPVYNEAPRLEASIEELLKVLDKEGLKFRVAIAEDGSTDGTPRVLTRLSRSHPDLIVQSLEGRRGRGYALRTLWSNTKADVYAFTDADLAAGPQWLLAGMQAIEAGCDVVTGSRYLNGSRVNRPPLRYAVSRAYNWLIRFWFHDSIHDHQCGLKLFTESAVRTLVLQTNEDSWVWDTEVLVLAEAQGLRVTEIPVTWVERKSERTSLRRLLKDIYQHGTFLIRLKSAAWRLDPTRITRVPDAHRGRASPAPELASEGQARQQIARPLGTVEDSSAAASD